MKYYIVPFFLLSLLFSQFLFSQSNGLTVVAHLDQKHGSSSDNPPLSYSGCWGYTAPNGREYAVLGTYTGTSIIDITDSAREVAFITGPTSLWREMRVYKNYAYAVSEGGGGTQIIDLSNLPASAALADTFVYTSGAKNTRRAHTIEIFNGYMYLNGCANWAPGGVLIFSLADPVHPQFLGEYAGRYIHDSYVRNDTLFGAAVYSGGGVDIVNVGNKAAPSLIARITYTGSGTHNAWTTTNGKYVISTDEIGSTQKTLKVWDISTLPTPPANPSATYTYSPADIEHNITIRGKYAYVAWYTAGTVVMDISDPLNPQTAGWYDSYAGASGSYDGVWSIYPFYPSGKIISGDMQSGLYVFRHDSLAARGHVHNLFPSNNTPVSYNVPITFRWTHSASIIKDPHYYNLHIFGNGFDTTIQANDSLISLSLPLQQELLYKWNVTTKDDFNTTVEPDTFQFQYGALIAPSNIAFSNITNHTVTLAWQDNSTHELGYHIYRSTSSNPGTYVQISGNLAPNTQQFTDTSLSTGKKYYYQISAYSTYGEGASVNGQVSTPVFVPPPVTHVSRSYDNIVIHVDSGSNPASTEIALRVDSGATVYYRQPNGLLGLNPAWYPFVGDATVSGLKMQSVYSIKIKARNPDGVETAFSSTLVDSTIFPWNVDSVALSEDFGNSASAQFPPAGWKTIDVTNDGQNIGGSIRGQWYFEFNNDFQTTKAKYFCFDDASKPANDYIFTKALQVTAGTYYRVSWLYRTSPGSGHNVALYLANTQSLSGILSPAISNKYYVTPLNPQRDSVYFTPEVSGTYYIGWWEHTPAFLFSYSLDDILIEKITGPVNIINASVVNDADGDTSTTNDRTVKMNWKVSLFTANNTFIDSQRTNSLGQVSFNSLVYHFPNGNYKLVEEMADGYYNLTPQTANVTVASSVVNNNFIIAKTGSMKGAVFNDKNGNGVRESGENKLPNVKLYVTGAKNDSTVSDGSGNYIFNDLPAGSYTVTIETQSGWAQTSNYVVPLVAGQNLTGKDFGNFQLGSIAGMVFRDDNDNGINDGGESALTGWQIILSGPITDSIITGGDGTFTFINLPAGTYTITEVLQNTWTQTVPLLPASYSITIQSGWNWQDKDFGNVQLGSISGTVFNDVNGNGNKDDGDNVIAQRKIKLSGTKSDSILTSGDGSFTFNNLLSGNYTLSEVAPSNWQVTSSPSPIALSGGTNSAGNNFGNFQYGTIGGVVFTDINGNGEKENTEPNTQNATVYLYNAGTLIDSAVTSEEGYFFSHLSVGMYAVQLKQTSGITQTTLDPDSIPMVSGLNSSQHNIGIFTLGAISGTVYNDANHNDTLDSGETGLSGWVVTLAKGNSTVGTDTTDNNGAYSFTGLTAGDYTIAPTSQAGYLGYENSTGASVTVVSGTASVAKFGTLLDSAKFRTFNLSNGRADFATKAGSITLKAVKGSKTAKYLVVSGSLNLRMSAEYIFAKAVSVVKGTVLTFGINLGKTDAAKTHGWLSYANATSIGKFVGVAQTGAPFPIDSLTHNNIIKPGGKRTGKIYTKAITPTDKNNNMLWGEGTIFKFNLMASQYSIIPANFGALTLDTAYTLFGRNLQGATLSTFAMYVDSLMTFWSEYNLYDTAGSSGNFLTTQAKMLTADSGLTTILSRINNGFYSRVDTVDSNSRGTHDYMDSAAVAAKMKYALVLRGVKSAKEGCSFLKHTPGKVAEVLDFASRGSYTLPEDVALGQNYPNPFNPTTTINVAIPEHMDGAIATLKVYNVLGQEVATVINNEAMSAGDNAVTFDAAKLSSGVYFYRLSLNGGEVTAIKKMMLLK